MRLISDFALAVICIWQEARSEPNEGKVAVGEVIRNRMKKKGQNVAQVVLAPLQFSGMNAHDVNRVPSFQIEDTDPVVVSCANAWLVSATSNLTNGALNYFNPKTSDPMWASELQNPVMIGSHLFGIVP